MATITGPTLIWTGSVHPQSQATPTDSMDEPHDTGYPVFTRPAVSAVNTLAPEGGSSVGYGF